jgi:hypothetical protein
MDGAVEGEAGVCITPCKSVFDPLGIAHRNPTSRIPAAATPRATTQYPDRDVGAAAGSFASVISNEWLSAPGSSAISSAAAPPKTTVQARARRLSVAQILEDPSRFAAADQDSPL